MKNMFPFHYGGSILHSVSYIGNYQLSVDITFTLPENKRVSMTISGTPDMDFRMKNQLCEIVSRAKRIQEERFYKSKNGNF